MKEKVFIETQGIVIKASKQWWLKINTKMFRTTPFDGAIFPYVIKVEYTVNDKKYYVRKWISAGLPVPELDSLVTVKYEENKPSKGKIILSSNAKELD